VRAAGRTDSGVHARHQVADACLTTHLDDRLLAVALARLLPEDVRPLGVRTVPADFHAQRSARRKTYRYRLDTTPYGNPHLARYALRCPRKFDLGRIEQALQLLPGRRDWSGFTDSRCRIRDRVRTMDRASWDAGGGGCGWLTFRADGFLTYMVRNLVGTLIDVGRGRMEVDDVRAILESGDRRRAAATAAARGLWLWQVEYDHDEAIGEGSPWNGSW
jgi:tRNA pseudouridine38-40 synthase